MTRKQKLLIEKYEMVSVIVPPSTLTDNRLSPEAFTLLVKIYSDTTEGGIDEEDLKKMIKDYDEDKFNKANDELIELGYCHSYPDAWYYTMIPTNQPEEFWEIENTYVYK